MKKENVYYLLLGGLISSVSSILITQYIVSKNENKRIQLDEKFKNKEFELNDMYIRDLALYYKRKSNRAKISKKYNDVKKYDFIYKSIMEYLKNKGVKNNKFNRNYITLK